MRHSFSAKQSGFLVRAERKARGRSQQWVAERVGCRRQTIADLEAGRNVALNILMGALAALGKGLAIVDARVELEHLKLEGPQRRADMGPGELQFIAR